MLLPSWFFQPPPLWIYLMQYFRCRCSARKTTAKGQDCTTVDVWFEVCGRAEFQPSIPSALMVHTQTFSFAELIAIGIIEILFNRTCDGSLLCCCIAVLARGVVDPWHRLVGSAHGVAGTLVGQFLYSTGKGFCHGNCKFLIMTQDVVAARIRSQTLTGVRSITAWSKVLAWRLDFVVAVSFKLICNYLCGGGCPSIDEGQVEACTDVEQQ